MGFPRLSPCHHLFRNPTFHFTAAGTAPRSGHRSGGRPKVVPARGAPPPCPRQPLKSPLSSGSSQGIPPPDRETWPFPHRRRVEGNISRRGPIFHHTDQRYSVG